MLRRMFSLFLILALLFAASISVAAYYVEYDYGYESQSNYAEETDPVVTVLVCIVVGLVVALIVTGTMKAQLKTVRHQSFAGQYIQQDSFHLTNSQDIFLYRNVTRTARPKDKK